MARRLFLLQCGNVEQLPARSDALPGARKGVDGSKPPLRKLIDHPVLDIA